VARGNTQFSLRDLARKAGVSHQAPYHHFGSRGRLLGAIALEGFERFRASLQEARLQGGEGPALLKRMSRAYLDFALTHPEHYHLMFLSPDVEFPDASELGEPVGALSFQELVIAVEQLRAEGRLGAGSVLQHATSIWAWVHGFATLLIRDRLTVVGMQRPLSDEAFDGLYSTLEKLFAPTP
jgi:AcrR family transcriptional regulator